MKSGVSCLLLAVLACASRMVAGSFAAQGLSPVSRVVQLLKDLQMLCEENLDKETKAFEKFKCWATTTKEMKTASNEKAAVRLESVKQYLADLEAGRIELTSERVDLEKEVSTLTAELETAEALREKEKEDYEAAKEETETAISAMEEAIEVLEEAKPEETSFLSERKSSSNHRTKKSTDFEALSFAVKFGRRFLSKGDAIFLERVLTGDVPSHDWKKLNRKADFKMSYKSRTDKIVQTLKNLKFNFETTLSEMTKKEEDAQATYDKLKEAKGAQKDAATEALGKMELEGAARGQTKGEAQAEIEDLEKQIENDEKFIEQAKTDLEEKDKEFVARKGIRMDEIKAISEAIKVLHNDDSRDLFKKSLSSQGYVQISAHGYSFLQQSSRSHVLQSAPRRASRLLLNAAKSAGGKMDKRLVSLAKKVGSMGGGDVDTEGSLGEAKFDEVIAEIDKIVALLEEEEEADLKTKEDCETARMEDTRESITIAREIDDLSDAITSAKGKIAELETEMEEKGEEIKTMEEELESATTLRDDEKAAHAKTDKDDEDAAATIDQAVEVLEGFYKEMGFIQKRRQPTFHNDFTTGEGEAPPPPPPTWDEPEYTGRDKESAGILVILATIKEDIEADRTKAQEAEDKAQEKYDTFKSETETAVGDLQTAITELEGTKAEKEQEVEDDTEERNTQKGELATIVDKIKGLQPGCDYMLVNYVVRSANRKIEIDGLEKAKAVLKGGEFDESDPDRELKPGDALVQKSK